MTMDYVPNYNDKKRIMKDSTSFKNFKQQPQNNNKQTKLKQKTEILRNTQVWRNTRISAKLQIAISR